MIVEVLLVRQDTDTLHLLLQSVLCKSGLSDVGPVQTVHAVGPDDTGLSMSRFCSGSVSTDVDVEVAHLAQLLMQGVYQ